MTTDAHPSFSWKLDRVDAPSRDRSIVAPLPAVSPLEDIA
jgi:hypothetical protein